MRRVIAVLFFGLGAFSAGWLLGPAVPGPTAHAQTKEAPAENASTRVLTETVGLFAGLNLYQTYLNIGLLADGYAEGLYEEKEVKQLLGSVLTPLEAADKQLDKVGKLPLNAADRAAIARLRKILGLLRKQGAELQAFWETGKPEHGNNYEAIRKEAWAGISNLLGLK